MPRTFLNRLKVFDVYPRTVEDFREQTWHGALVSICCILVALVLFFSEFRLFLQTETVQELHVDTSYGEKLQININITFPSLECSALSLDIIDVSGDQQLAVEHNLHKHALDKSGQRLGPEQRAVIMTKREGDASEPDLSLDPSYCGSCYGAETEETQCCNTCAEVQEAYRLRNWAFSTLTEVEQCKREGYFSRTHDAGGCNLHGILTVNRVAGYFQISPGHPIQGPGLTHDMRFFSNTNFNLSHVINRLSFGEDFPGIRNPLDGHTRITQDNLVGVHQYFLKVVPTKYSRLNGNVLNTNQFAVTDHFKPAMGRTLPGVFFMFDISPIMVTLVESRRSFWQFLTSVCAIIGGVVTTLGLIESCLYTSFRRFKHKMLLGKAT